jgi:colanic acid/amylovoran biosynthesis protein
MTTKVLILNVHSTRNAGDAALASMTLDQLKDQFSPLDVTLSMDDPSSFSGEGTTVGSLVTWLKETSPTGKPRWKKWNLIWLLPACLIPIFAYRSTGRAFYGCTPAKIRALIQAYLEADLVVSEAGGFLYHSGSGLTLLVALFSLALAILSGKPLYIFPQSIGLFRKGWECTLVRWVLNRARVVMVRESISLQVLGKCGLRKDHCRLIPDLAFGFESAPAEEAEAWLVQQGIDPAQDRPLLGLTMINWGAQDIQFGWQDRYEAAVAGAARYFIEQYQGKAIFIPQVWGPLPSQDDRVPAGRVSARLSDLAEHVHLIHEPLPPELLKAVYGQMDLFIGTRMHSNIFALSEGVPVIAIGYQHKTEGIARMLDLGDWVIDIQRVDEKELIQLLRHLVEQREDLRKKIQAQLPQIVQSSRQAGRIIAADYQHWMVEHGRG